jgi:hypothetical protein
MSEFVNYNKRDVALAAHCKDLIDVLRRIDPATPTLVSQTSRSPAMKF